MYSRVVLIVLVVYWFFNMIFFISYFSIAALMSVGITLAAPSIGGAIFWACIAAALAWAAARGICQLIHKRRSSHA